MEKDNQQEEEQEQLIWHGEIGVLAKEEDLGEAAYY